MKLLFSTLAQSTTGKKEVKLIFKTKKAFMTCSKLLIYELGRCPTRLDNVNKHCLQLLLVCFVYAEHNEIKVI